MYDTHFFRTATSISLVLKEKIIEKSYEKEKILYYGGYLLHVTDISTREIIKFSETNATSYQYGTKIDTSRKVLIKSEL
ncbi:hypothetical protein HHI36_002739, partial [Cryptolaemus montrouzieri]